jgi:hypothetical protein
MCLAISEDQGHTWSKYGVVLNPTIDGCSDETWVSQGAVMRREPGDWIMVYSWRGGTYTLPGTRYAISTDGKTWHGHGVCSNSLTTWPLYLEQHQIMMLGGKCVLIYETGNMTVPWTIGMASAATCEGPFTVSAHSPIVRPSASGWDSTLVATPYFFTVGGTAYLWYSGTNESTANYNLDHWPMSIGTFNLPGSAPKTKGSDGNRAGGPGSQ